MLWFLLLVSLYIADAQFFYDSSIFIKNFMNILVTIPFDFSSCFRTVMPQIEAFAFNPNGVNGGGSLKILCTVISGDSPIQIQWLKDGQSLNMERSHHKVQHLDEQTVLLSLSQLSLEDSGNYSCTVTNLAGSISHSSVLKVKGTEFSQLFDSCVLASAALKLSRCICQVSFCLRSFSLSFYPISIAHFFFFFFGAKFSNLKLSPRNFSSITTYSSFPFSRIFVPIFYQCVERLKI